MKKILFALLVMSLFVTPQVDAKNAKSTGTKNIDVTNTKEIESTDDSVREQLFYPEGNIDKITVLDGGSIEVMYDLTDTSNILMHTNDYKPEVRIYEGSTLIKSKKAKVGQDQVLKFRGLEEGKEYTILLSGPYDIIGMGVPTNSNPYELDKNDVVIVKDKAEPTANIHLETDTDPSIVNQDNIELHYDIVDDETSLINEGTVGPRIVVQDTEDNSLVYPGSATVGFNQVENIVGLEIGKTYRVSIVGQYDINYDGVTDNISPYVLDSEEFTLGDGPTENKPGESWNKVYGGGADDQFKSVIETADGGYVAVGYTDFAPDGEITDATNGSTDGLMVKFDSEGNKQWDQVYGGSSYDEFTDVALTQDGGYIVVGQTYSSASGEITDENNGNTDGLLVKFDGEGNYVWDQVYGGDDKDSFQGVTPTQDGGYVVVGQSYSSASGEITDSINQNPYAEVENTTDGLIVKFDGEGNYVWDNLFGGTGGPVEMFYSVVEDTDGGYVTVGYTGVSVGGEITDENNGKNDGFIVKFDGEGNPVWNKVYGGVENDSFKDIVVNPNGGYTVIGETESTVSGEITSTNAGGESGLIVSFDSQGNYIWDQIYGGAGSDKFEGLTATSDGYIAVGTTETLTESQMPSEGTLIQNGMIVKFNNYGDVFWDEIIGGDGQDSLYGVLVLDDDSYVVVGSSTSSASGSITETNNGKNDGWIVKFQ